MAKEKDEVAVEDVPVSENVAKRRADFKNLIEVYKAQNPAKYELKKDELAKKLAAIK